MSRGNRSLRQWWRKGSGGELGLLLLEDGGDGEEGAGRLEEKGSSSREKKSGRVEGRPEKEFEGEGELGDILRRREESSGSASTRGETSGTMIFEGGYRGYNWRR